MRTQPCDGDIKRGRVRVGEHAQGESHADAVGLLARANKEAAKHLSTLLKLKTKSGYSHTPATTDEFKRAGRAAEMLVEQARRDWGGN